MTVCDLLDVSNKELSCRAEYHVSTNLVTSISKSSNEERFQSRRVKYKDRRPLRDCDLPARKAVMHNLTVKLPLHVLISGHVYSKYTYAQ